MTNVAVTGCASRFGRVLLPLLEADPQVERIVGIDVVAPAETYSKLEFVQKDIRDPGLKNVLSGCETLVHLAFIVGRPYSIPLQEAADINLRGTWNACRAAAEAGVTKLVVSSSIAAYGGLPDNPDPLLEDSPLRGLYADFYYSQHKHANEIWLDGFQLEYPKLIITRLRPCIVVGPQQAAAGLLFNPDNTYFATPGSFRNRIQLVHEEDLASAFYLAVQRNLPGAYNVVVDESEPMAVMAQAAGVNIIEVEAEAWLNWVDTAWKQGVSNLGPEWLRGEGSIICSNAKLKAAGWEPAYPTTFEAYLATLTAVRKATATA